MTDLNSKEENIDNIYKKEEILRPCRCPNCYLIPFITLYEENNELKMKFKCPNKHEYDKDFESLYNMSKIDLDNLICHKCSMKKLNNKFYICSQCNKFYCKKCKNEHKNENNDHLLINFKKYDSRCKEHNKDLIGYCEEHNKNYCDYCPNELHIFKRHKLIYNGEMNKYLDIINNYENKINNNKNELNKLIKNIEKSLTTIKNLVNVNQKKQKMQINFQKELIITYNNMKN